MQHKIGLYIRVSTEEQAMRSEGSLENQKHRLTSFVDIKNMSDGSWGKIVEHYIDDGYSAKDVRRPAYQRLMNDVKKGKITLILVTDVSRLSRNMLDFCGLLEDLKKVRAKYLSIKENFDTSTSAGELMIKTMMTLNEFERKQTAERVSTNFYARALRGLRNGGRILFGFDRNDNDLARLDINESEAAEVRQIFAVYLEEGTCSKTVRRLNEVGPLHKVKTHAPDVTVNIEPWTKNALLYFLRNNAYAGLREINKKNKNDKHDDLKPHEKYQVVKASWPAIVDETTWTMTQSSLNFSLKKDRSRYENSSVRHFMLTGTLYCQECSGKLMGSTSRGSKLEYRYYVHSHTKKHQTNCLMNWIPAEKIETAVTNHLSKILISEGYLDGIEDNIEKMTSQRNQDLDTSRLKIQEQLRQAELGIKKTIEVQTQCSDQTVDEAFKDRLRELTEEKKNCKVLLNEIDNLKTDVISPKKARIAIEQRVKEFNRALIKAKPAMKKKLIAEVFESIVLDHKGLILNYYMTDSDHVDLNFQSNESSDKTSEDSTHQTKILKFKAIQTPKFQAWGSLLSITDRHGNNSKNNILTFKTACGFGTDSAPEGEGLVNLDSWDGKVFFPLNDEIGRGDRIRTYDPLVPNQMRYQTALRPDTIW